MFVKDGYVADFKTGYLQIAHPEPLCEVIGGTDGPTGGKGYAPGRLVKVTYLSDGTCHIAAATSVSATSIGDATHIIAQSDDSLHRAIQSEQYNYMPTNVLKNTATVVPTEKTATMKMVALWKIVNQDDIKIIPVKHATISVVR